MDAEFVRERITQLRLQKGVSEYKMSYDLGHSRGYINNISSGKVLPSLTEFFAVCDYFDVTPAEFFSPQISDPRQMNALTQNLELLDEKDLELISRIAERMLKC